ncbi:MAG: S8 family serine peptidase, partial [Bryobacteraceae bacterium]
PTDQGSTCGLPSGTLCDPWVAAVANAARGNMVVVVPAGNSGNLGMGTINSPGDSPDAITVGASTNVHTLTSTVITPAGDRLEARLGDGPKPATSLKASLMTGAAVDSTGYGCLAFPQASLSGAIVVISTGQCADATKIFNAQAAGAAAVLLVEESVTAPLAAPRGLSNTSIPTALLTARSGAILKNYLSAHPGSLVTLDPAVSEARVADVEAIAPFSSRGPAIAGTSIKPDLVAPGGAIYTAAQSYDPNGDLYASARYAGVDGTSFAAAVVAGAAALIRQAHPSYSARQIKSALSNSAADISDNDGSPPPARSVAAGSGKLNLPSAIASTLTVEPVSISYGAVNGGLGPPRTITLTNTGQASAGIQLTVKRRDADSAAFVSLSPATFNLPAGQSQNVAVSLSGSVPPAGLYEGALLVAGGAVPLRIPYRYVVSDGKAAQLVPLLGAGFVTETGSAVNLAVRVMDRFGVSLSNLPVRFAPAAAVLAATATTDSLGIAEAYLSTTEVVGSQSFAVDLEGNAARISFIGRTRPRPQIREGGVVDAASGKVPSGFAPGSYVSLFGSGLSESTSVFHTPYLPLSLAGVAVSFDIPAANVHVSGRLHFVSAGQINVQIPWELAGASSALLKVTLSNSASQSGRPEDPDLGTFQTQVLSIPLAPHAPAFFEYKDTNTGRTLAAALNEMNAVVTPSNPMRTGQIVQFFVNGLGPVAAGTQPASGEASPGTQPLALTQTTPVLTIGGRAATVQFSGLAPGLVGVYQVNALVPRDIGSGFQPVAISIGGVTSSSSTIIAQ